MSLIIKKLFQRKKENQRGATAVELAIVLILFLTIVFGIIEFGLLIYNQHIVTNAGWDEGVPRPASWTGLAAIARA